MSYAYNRHAATFAKLHMMRNFFSEIPDMEGFIQEGLRAHLQEGDEEVHFINNEKDLKAWKQKYGIHFSHSPKGSSDEDSDSVEENDPERKAGSLLDEKKIKEKAEKKRLKKQRQKQRKRLEKQQNATQDNETKNITSQDSNGDKDYFKLKDMASALDSESDDGTSDGSGNEEDEGLDLTSTFVTKAAEIAKRKLEQKQENKDKKKSSVKEETKTPEKTLNEGNGDVKKDTSQDTVTSSPKMEDFVKISAEFATMGNNLAGAGDYKMAVKYFTDAIKYNPTEYRLFGNRAFCFERMQEYEKSLSDAELSLSMRPGWVKGLFRKGRALAGLKRYKEAACAFKEVLELDSSGTEAAQDLMRVQIMQLMECGFTREQSSNALIIHGNVEKAREVLSKINKSASPPPVPLQQVANVTGVSPGLSAKAAAAPRPPPATQDASKTRPENKPLIPVQNQQSQAKPDAPVAPKYNHVVQAPELFPVWVGNLSLSVTESLLGNLFNKVGTVYSIKQLSSKRCAFINFTQQQHCEDAIRRYHGFELMGSKLAVRYPDRIPPGLNISRAAHKADDVHDENFRYNQYGAGRTGNGKSYHHNYRDLYKY